LSPTPPHKRSSLGRLLAYARRSPWAYTAGGILTVAYGATLPLIPVATRDVVDALADAAARATVGERVTWLIALAAGVALIRVASRIVVFRTARQIEYGIRNDLLAHLQRLPQSYFGAHRTGDLMSRGVNDLNSVRLFLGMGLLNLVQTPVLYGVAFSYMLAADWVLTLAIVAPYLLFVAIIRYFARHMQPASLAVQEQLGQLSAVVQENAAGVFVVRAYGMEPQERERFRAQNAELYARQIRFGRISLSMQPTIAVMPALAMVALLLGGGLRVQAGEVSLGEFMEFYTFLMLLTPPTVMLGFTVVLAQRGLAGLARLGEILDVVPQIRESARTTRVGRVRGAVRIEDLSFAYPTAASIATAASSATAPSSAPQPHSAAAPADTPRLVPAGTVSPTGVLSGTGPLTVGDGAASGAPAAPSASSAAPSALSVATSAGRLALDDVSLSAAPGQTIGIVGAIGSGKTTLVSAIPRLIEFPEEAVFIDDVDVTQLPLEQLRRAIAMVPQDSFLFSCSVAENIAFGRPGATQDEIRKAAERAQVLEDILDLPYGFDTPVGERGITLSGGQRQRIALARALMLEPSILILDDALASVDAVTEEAILKSLRDVRSGRTCFIVAHRLSAVRDADRIVVLDAGRVVESGTHTELLALNGLYARIFRRQQLERELSAEGAA
jgi:ATP-binding cassette, subfamily B, multidrug efflux pump